jgi:glutathione S-transferase
VYGVSLQGLDDELESVEVDLQKKPEWYKQVYPLGKVIVLPGCFSMPLQ